MRVPIGVDMVSKTMDDLVSLCKRRGFIFQSNEIYGGLQGLYDYGPLGVELKNNLKTAWWKSVVYNRIFGIRKIILRYLNHSTINISASNSESLFRLLYNSLRFL